MTIEQTLNLHEDAVILLAHVLKKDKAWLLANQDKKLSKLQATTYKLLIAKRLQHWPVAYLTGHKEFFGLDFKITPDVLTPRPETELLVELALKNFKSKISNLKSVVDIGTGCGNIVTSIAKKLSEYHRLVYDTTHFYAIDSSNKALALAKANAKKHGVLTKIKFLQGNLLDSLSALPLMRGRKSGGRSIVIANLPYLTDKQYRVNYDLHREPPSALVGGKDGLKYFRELFKQIKNSPQLPSLIKEGKGEFIILLEHGPAQKPKLKAAAQSYFPNAKVKFHKDLWRRYRVIEIKT